MSIICPNPICRHQNRYQARFCGKCRTSLLQTGLLSTGNLLTGRYRIVERVGEGGMAFVYRAEDIRLTGKVWAVKEMSDQKLSDPVERQEAVLSFQREAQLLVNLNHPNIPKIVDSFQEGGKHYLVMEFVEGQTIEDLLIAKGVVFHEPEIRPWLEQLCDALQYLHSRHPPIIYRDLKPDNIMINSTGRVKLIDFGIARLFQPGKTKDTSLLGTQGYASPEHYGRGQTDQRSDIYALGVTLHRMLTGFDPVDSPFNLPSVQHLNPSISTEMEQVITKAIEHQPEKRWRSIAEIQNILRIQPSTGGKRQVSPPTAHTPTIRPSPTTRPTTRLLLTMANVSNEQLALGILGTVAIMILAVWLFAPVIKDQFPLLWDSVPIFLIAGPMAFSATRRAGVSFVSNAVVAMVFWVTIWARAHYLPEYAWLLAAVFLSGLVFEGGFYLLPRIVDGADDEGWRRELTLFSAVTVIAAIVFYAPSPLMGYHSLMPGVWLSAAGLGILGWFLGDLVQQWLFLKQTGVRRTGRP